jgi:hypothetical protein
MNQKPGQRECPECKSEFSRRDFLASAAGAAGVAVAASALPLILPKGRAWGAPTPKSDAESAVRRLFDSLTDEQRKTVVLPLDDSRRQNISANWHITEASVGSFSEEQQRIIDDVLKGATSEDGYERIKRQMADDDAPGLSKYSVAIFGSPHEEQFLFELTGRHCTLRADGDSIPGAAFGGPIVYGHGARGNSTGNLFVYQTKQANELFAALDGKQREKALLESPPSENAVQLRKEGEARPGITAEDLSEDQRELVTKTIRAILQPYRQDDVDEVMEVIEAGGGLASLNMAFYKGGDLDEDGQWDIWRVEGPTFVSHFRGAPHVHAYLNVARRS